MKQQMKRMATILLVIGLMTSMIVAGYRINAEYHHKTVQIAIRYGDVLKIVKETSKSLEEVLREYQEAGVTTLIVRENTILSPNPNELLGDKEQGLVELIDGQAIQTQFADETLDPHLTYVVTEDETTFDRIYTHLTVKGIEVSKNVKVPYYMIGIQEGDKASLQTIGTGFIQEDLEVAASLGYAISPEVRGWTEATEESINWMVDEIETIPALNYIYFEDKVIPGFSSEAMIRLIKEYGLGFIEFYSPNQKGFDELAYKSRDEEGRFQLIRMFTDEKVPNISTPNRIARYELALTERGIRAFTFLLEEDEAVAVGSESLKADIQTFAQHAINKGYDITKEQKVYSYKPMNSGFLILMGMSTLGMILLLMIHLKLPIIGMIATSVTACGYVIGIFVARDLSVQAMALITAIVFPVYAIVSQVKEERKMSYQYAILTFLKISGITMLGGITVVGLLSQAQYALGIDGFRGVKLAHIVPIVMVVILFSYQYRKQIKLELKQLLQTKVSYGPILLILCVLVIGGVFAIYIMRTGNGDISEIEKVIRQGLDQVLGVRPRTKEFLIGHPLFVALLYFGYKGLYVPVLMLATIGQISLMNTYAHIHTPLVVSLIRSAYGIGIGIIIGIILIQVVKFIFKVINKWIIKQK